MHHYGPGEPWFEAGPIPVFAQADAARDSRCVRVSILPRALEGKSSITYVLPEDRDKHTVIALREIAEGLVTSEILKEVEVDTRQELEEVFAPGDGENAEDAGEVKAEAEESEDTTEGEISAADLAALADLIESAPMAQALEAISDEETQDADDTGDEAEEKPVS